MLFWGWGKKGGEERGWRRKESQHLLELNLGSTVTLHYAADHRPFLPAVMWGRGTGGKAGGDALGFLEWLPTPAPDSPLCIATPPCWFLHGRRMSAKVFQMLSGSLRVSDPIRELGWHCYL